MLVCKEIKTKVFAGETHKSAYMNCCKWLASNVLAKNNSDHVLYDIKKGEGDGAKTVTLTLYMQTDMDEIQNKHCAICKEVTSSFFIKENKYQCEMCKLLPFKKRIEDRMEVIKKSLKEKGVL